MKYLNRLLDFLSLNFAFYGIFFFNKQFPEPNNAGYFVLQLVLLFANLYVCFVILKSKDTVTNTVIEGCKRNRESKQLPDEEREQLRTILRRHLQLGDLADASFGRFGRLVTESAVVLCIICMVTSQMCTTRLTLIITCDIANQTNASSLPVAFANGWGSTTGAYAAIFLPIFIILSMAPSYRCLGFLSAIGIIGIVIGLYYLTLAFVNTGYTQHEIILQQIYKVYDFEIASPQIGLLILSLSNSAYDNRRGFRVSLLVAAGMCFAGIVFTRVSLLVSKLTDVPVPLEMKFGKDIGVNAVIISAYIVAVFILNIPLFELCERRMSPFFKSSTHMPELHTLDLLDSDRSLFRTLRRRSNSYFLGSSLSLTTVARELKPCIPTWFSLLLRATIVSIEWGVSCLRWEQKYVIVIFILLEVVSTIFIGCVFPLIQYLRLHWHEVRMVVKLFSLAVVVAATGIAALTYYFEGTEMAKKL